MEPEILYFENYPKHKLLKALQTLPTPIYEGFSIFRHKDLPLETLKISPEVERRQKERLAKVKSGRDPKRVAERLARIKNAAASKENLMPVVIDAVRDYVTLGEIVATFKEVFGTYRDPGHF